MQIQTPTNGDLSLYFHLPFCQKKCDYCHFFVLPNRASFKDELLKSLLKEIHLKKESLIDSTLCSIYFGGGTPALVGPAFIETLLKSLPHSLSLDTLEITLEINPENRDIDLLKAYHNLGVNRLSIGVQTLEDSLLKKLNRTHSSKDALEAIENAHLAGFENISVDLMYDLPTQTLSDWKRTLRCILNYPISHLSLYNLTIEKETVFYKHRKKILSEMPEENSSLELFQYACKALKKADFNQYEISAFCKENYYSRHNVGYWQQRPHLGFGPSAFSLLPPKRFQNVKNLKKYTEALNQGLLPIDFTETLTPEAFLRESLAIGLRILEGISLNAFQKRFGTFSKDLLEIIERLKRKKWLELNEDKLKLSFEGLLYHDSLASELILESF